MKIVDRKLWATTKSFMLLVVLLVFTGCSGINSKADAKNLDGFKILIEKTDEGIALKGMEGTAWTNLEFSSNPDKAQLVNERGMASVKDAANSSDNLADFLIETSRTPEGVSLKGLEGTAWTNLSFTIAEGGRQMVSETGMESE